MDVVNYVNKLLNKPFPEDESRFGSPRIITLMSVFITFFLYVFQPFGIHTLESRKFLICLGFGSMTFFAIIIYEFIISQMLKLKGEREKWTFGKWIINNLGIMFAISLANFLYARLILLGYIDWSLFPQMIYATFMIGLIPVIGLGWYSLNKQEKKYQYIADEINQREHNESSLKNNHNLSFVEIPTNQIRYAEALQNYVKIGYVDERGQFIKRTERATLKSIIKETEGSALIKCHRSFLVNRNAIVSTSGNAQGLLLTLSGCDEIIPVSRSYVADFRNN